ncbi:two-partner secretion domain-containing protein [Haemophilus influenzae]|uniref:two-partner secretion domain-containing protein n=1 Tax=Haemophilus influenzae TaxID=727 RepID=UPI0005BED764|nr:filamentous hemagglutinin N-terminal domain-containing protein [Haemophilus influenzae]AJO89810.1 Heme:hemopexin utilization protein A [Haemophilus influenzae]
MNKIYRLKFSKRLNALVAVSELTRGCDHSTEKGSEKPARMKVRHLALKPLSAMLLSLGVTSIPQSVLASGLQGMNVVHGTATMQVDGNKTIIRNSVDAIINWKQFNINQNEMVQFLQENNNSAVFNRVTSNQISQLKGILDSNGQVFLINPNGVAIGKNAIINTNGFTASTLDISNENIKARNFTFEQTKDKALAEIVNHGLITVGKDGSVNLIGGKVKNEGVISVNGGSISLLAGQKITISDIINPTITYSIAAPENEAINLGDIFAKGGNINIRAANIRNQGKLSADSVSKDKSGNIVLSAKEGEAEIGGVISAQNQQAKGGKLMITGDKVTLKTGAVIDLSGKEGGETYLGGDERGEGKNGIQLAKKTSLEKGSTINVSGKEKGGRAIVWGDIALIDGNINARGSDITKTGGFVETSGHDLFIGDDAIVDAKEWLLDPDNVSINAPSSGRHESNEDNEYTSGTGLAASPKVNNQSRSTLTNSTLENILKRGSYVNITATNKIYVNSSINLSNGSLTLYTQQDGVEINGDITSKQNGNLTIKAGSWVDVHKNITLGRGFLNITARGSVAFEKAGSKDRAASDATITAQGVITAGSGKDFRFNNVSLNGTGTGLKFITAKGDRGNFSAKFDGVLNISGKISINHTANDKLSYVYRQGYTYWNLTQLNVDSGSSFSLTSKKDARTVGQFDNARRKEQTGGIGFTRDTIFNVKEGAKVDISYTLPISPVQRSSIAAVNFDGNITVKGGGVVNLKFNALSNNYKTPGVNISSSFINVTEGSRLNITGSMPSTTLFNVANDLTINATNSFVSIKEIEGTDTHLDTGLKVNGNVTIKGGDVTLGSNKAKTRFNKNVTVEKGANLTLASANFGDHKGALTVVGNINTQGKLVATGDTIDVSGNFTVENDATFNGNTNNNLNITGNFTNNGTSEINIKQGVVNLGNVTNGGNLNITTNAKTNQKSIINGDIINKKGNLNITNNGNNAEIQIGGNISQKEGNLTISSDKINITKQITIKAGVNGEHSGSDAESNANLTIKTKELKLVEDLNISGFNKAEITAKNGNDLTIGEASSSGDSDAKKVTFNKVKDSKISADGRNVTLNSKVETSNGGSNAGNDGNDNSTGLTISAKDVTVNNNVTSHKTINISAEAGNVTTKEGTTINATTGSVEVTAQNGTIEGNITSQNVTVAAKENLVTAENAVINATSGTVNISTKTGEINGEVKSTSGNVNITASGDTLKVSNITGQDVTVTASSGAITTTEGSTISATTGNANITTNTGNINGKVESSSGSVTLIATGQTLAVGNISGNTVTITADTGKLTTTEGSTINATASSVTISTKQGELKGAVEAKQGNVDITAKEGALTISNVTAKNNVAVKAETGKLTTQASSSITSSEGQTTLTAKDGSIEGSINAANVTLNTTGTLTTVKGSNIKATSGTLAINAKDAKLNGAASGNHTVVNATNASGSGSVTAETSSNVNITGDLSTVNGLNIISKNGKNTVVLKGAEIDVKYIQPGVASVEEVIEAKRVLEKVKDLSDEERETLAKLGVSAVRFVEPNNTITVNTQNEFTTRPSSQVTISEGKACFSSGNGAAVCTNVADDGQQ